MRRDGQSSGRLCLSGNPVGGVVARAILAVLLMMVSRQVLAQEGGWSVPVMISTNTASSWFPDVAVDGWGQPHVVWSSGRGTDERGQMDLLMYSSFADQGWLEPNDIALTAYGGYTVRPAIAVDNGHTIHVTFRGETTIYYTSSPLSQAWDASSWTPRKRISGAGNGSAYYSDIAVDENGRIHVVWNEGLSPGLGDSWLWVATSEGSLLYDGESWEESVSELAERQVYAIVEDNAGIQWFGTDDGIYRFDGISWESFGVQDGLVARKVNCIMQGTDDRMWFGTDGGVSIYDEAIPRPDERWTAHTAGSDLPDSVVNAIATDPLGRIWFGTGNGLASYDGQNWKSYTPQDGLVAAEVLALAADSEGVIWSGTREGVSRYDGEEWITYTIEDGLLSNAVTGVAVDREDTVWFGTDRGVTRFNGQYWTSYTADDGLVEGAVTTLTVDSEGRVWVGTERGVTFYEGGSWEVLELPGEVAAREVTAIGKDRHVNAMCPSCADVFYRRSTDGGETWSAPVNLSRSFAGSTKPEVRVASGGRVYVTWEEGEDWYVHQGYPLGSEFVSSSDGGDTWTEPTVFTSSLGAPQQITLGVGQEDDLVVVWRLPELEGISLYYYQVSRDAGVTWSDPQPLPGVIAKSWAPFSLDAYDAATDSAGRVHLLVLGRFSNLELDLGVIHLVWDGSEWRSPVRIFASSNPPEWPRINIGAGNQLYATWFTRDERHIEDPERGRYKIWVSSYQADAPSQPSPPSPMPAPGGTPTVSEEAVTPTTAAVPPIDTGTSGVPSGLYTESDEVGWVIVALLPTVAILLVVLVVRLGWSRRRR